MGQPDLAPASRRGRSGQKQAGLTAIHTLFAGERKRLSALHLAASGSWNW